VAIYARVVKELLTRDDYFAAVTGGEGVIR